jgi:hypothetical protein
MEDNLETRGTSAAETAVAYPMTSYADVMGYLHSIRMSREDKAKVARRLTVEVTQSALADAYERIDYLSTLRKGWDGHGALPISQRVLRNIKAVLMISDNDDWQNWAISPDGNATIGLQSTVHKTLISLGALEYSYFSMLGGKPQGESHIPFTPEGLLAVMRKFE